jgi:multimeric flavodoxin WrbA
MTTEEKIILPRKILKLLAIVGSPRLKGNTNYLVDQALTEAAKLGAQTEKIILSQYQVNPCLGHDDCASFDSCLQKDDAVWILDRVRQADGVILATPVYYYNVSAQMKAFIDRNHFLYKHEQKYKARAVGIIIVAEQEGIEDTLHTLKQFIDEFAVEEDKIFIASGYASKLGEAERKLPLVEAARKLGRQMAESLKRAG